MKAHWAKLGAKLMRMAAEEFGNHGCNDMNLDELGLSRDEQIDVVTFMNERNRTPEEVPEAIRQLPFTHDFGVMYAVAAKLDTETGSKSE